MESDQIHTLDPKRLLFGDAPATFLLEIAVRAFVTYLILLIAARLMGKRVAGQMSVLELTVIVTLGAAIGVPLEAPDRGLLPAVLVLAIATGYQRLVGYLTFKKRRAVTVLEGEPYALVRDGVLQLDVMKRASISRERIFAMLRSQQLLQLGQVKRAYLEAGGQLSVYLDEQPAPGLCLLPEEDREAYERQFGDTERFACRSCGTVIAERTGPERPCPACHQQGWEQSVGVTAIRELRPDRSHRQAPRGTAS
jgi:uncharacterized membrane protein YcaP (DUF421 family)